MAKDTIILLASNGNNIGKSTTAKLFKEYLDKYTYANTHVLSFAEPIRKQVELLYSTCINTSSDSLSFRSLYTQEDKNTKLGDVFFKNDLAFASKLREMTPRLLVNEYSDLVQEFISPQVWANAAYLSILDKVNNNKPYSCNVFIFDDFRREIEYDYLKEQLPSFNIITIYLDKEGIKNQVSTSYEGQLKDFNFTYTFTFTEDYKNFDDLVDLVLKDIDYKEIVINRCYGGYGLSSVAIKKYLDIKNIPYYVNSASDYLDTEYVYLKEDNSIFTDSDLERDDPVLIQVVKELENSANDDYSRLQVVKIPSKLKYKIIEYDGYESVTEDFKTFV